MCMNIYESAEDYLERILILQEKGNGVRSIDIAHDMGFSKPSISVAMKKLKEAGLIDIDEHGFITLTKEGHVIADKVYERHKVLKQVLIDIGVPLYKHLFPLVLGQHRYRLRLVSILCVFRRPYPR